MLRTLPLVSSGTGIVFMQSGSRAWDLDHYSVLYCIICNFFSYIVVTEQCQAHNKVYRSTGSFQWHLIGYSIRLAKYALLSVYVCMYIFLHPLDSRFLFPFLKIVEFPEVLRNYIAQTYMATLDLKIRFSHHTFNFTFILLEMDKNWGWFVYFCMSLILKGRNKWVKFIVVYSCPVNRGSKFLGIVKLFSFYL